MLGRVANNLFWMARYLERLENNARLIDAIFRLSLTNPTKGQEEWVSILKITGSYDAYIDVYGEIDEKNVIDFMLRGKENDTNILQMINFSRANARTVRTELTRQMWQSINNMWITITPRLRRSVEHRNLTDLLDDIRAHTTLVRGALHGSMLRNDIFNFLRLGTYMERSGNTSRALVVKYNLLLPSASIAVEGMEDTHWETILGLLSATRSYNWLNKGSFGSKQILDYLIKDMRIPRSLAYCYSEITGALNDIEREYGLKFPSGGSAERISGLIDGLSIDEIENEGLRASIQKLISDTGTLNDLIEKDFNFNR